jgi:hypothetical protein
MNISVVGIRYVGKKDRQEDTVCMSGAVWLPGQVHNFSSVLAAHLLKHTDSFEEAPLSMEGQTFMSRGKGKQKSQEVAAFVNLSAMSADQLIHFARLEFNRVVNPEGKDEGQIRSEVHGLMANHNLDLEADRQKEVIADGKVAVTYQATPEEYAALMAGTVVLAIMPAELATVPEPPPVDNDHIEPGSERFSEPVPSESVTGERTDEPPKLDVLLAGLEKTELLAFARQEGVAVANTMTAEKLREKIFAELSERGTV